MVTWVLQSHYLLLGSFSVDAAFHKQEVHKRINKCSSCFDKCRENVLEQEIELDKCVRKPLNASGSGRRAVFLMSCFSGYFCTTVGRRPNYQKGD